jgi:hypothetical protein
MRAMRWIGLQIGAFRLQQSITEDRSMHLHWAVLDRRVLVPALVMACAFLCSAAQADNQMCTPDFPRETPGRAMSDSQLDRVRGGALRPEVPQQQLGVILWDERALPTPPVRNIPVDTRVTAEMNVLTR